MRLESESTSTLGDKKEEEEREHTKETKPAIEDLV